MRIENVKSNSRSSILKGLAVLLVLFAIVLTPILSSADTIPVTNDTDYFHGRLDVNALNVSMPISDSIIKTSNIVEKSKPSATHIMSKANSVEAAYFISDENLEKLNSVKTPGESVEITLYGEYLYRCYVPTCPNPVRIVGQTSLTVTFTAAESTPIYTVIFSGNGGKVNGQNEQTIEVKADNEKNASVGSSNMPTKVARDGYTFKGWSTSKKEYIEFTSNTVITGDTTVYAHWNKNPDKKPDEKPDEKSDDKKKKDEAVVEPEEETPTKTRYTMVLNEPDTNINDHVGPTTNVAPGNDDTFHKKTSYTKAEFISLAKHQNVPVANIGNGSVPLYAPEGTGSWAFVNLLCALMGLLMAIVSVVYSMRQNRDKKSKWLRLSMAAAIAGIAFFFITENLNQYMVLADRWTIISVIIFIISIVSVILCLRRNEGPEEFTYHY